MLEHGLQMLCTKVSWELRNWTESNGIFLSERFESVSEMAFSDSLGQFPTHSAQEGTLGTWHHHRALRPGNGISPMGRRFCRLLTPQPALPPSGRPRHPWEAASAYRRLPCGGTSASASTAAAVSAASCPCCVAASHPCWP